MHLNNWINQTTVDYGENVDKICGYITTLDNWLESVRAGNVGIADELEVFLNKVIGLLTQRSELYCSGFSKITHFIK